MMSKLLAPATSDQRPAFVGGIVSALLVLPVFLNGVINAGGSLRALYAAGLALMPVQVALCAVRLRRGRRHGARNGLTKQ